VQSPGDSAWRMADDGRERQSKTDDEIRADGAVGDLERGRRWHLRGRRRGDVRASVPLREWAT